MRFKTELERQQHLLARLIPKSIWESDNYFAGQLTKDQIELMGAPEGDLIQIILNKTLHDNVETDWLAIAFGHPEISAETLLVVARYLGITSPAILFSLGVRANRTSVLLEMIKEYPDLRLPEVSQYPLLMQAIHHENQPMVELILRGIGTDARPVLKFMDYKVFREAVRMGNLEMVLCLMARATNKHEIGLMLAANNYEVFKSAVRYHRSEIIEHFLTVCPADQVQSMIQACHAWAIQHHQHAALNFLSTVPAVRSPLSNIVRSTLKGVSVEDLHAVQEKLNLCGKLGAAIHAEIECLQRWHSKGPKLRAIVAAVLKLPADISFSTLRQQFLDDENPLPQALALPLDNSRTDEPQLAEIEEIVRHSPGPGSVIL